MQIARQFAFAGQANVGLTSPGFLARVYVPSMAHKTQNWSSKTLKISVFIACSLDGFIAETDGNLDWLTRIPNETNDDYGYNEFISRIDAIIMGRKTFEKVQSFDIWPYEKPVFVLSNSLTRVTGMYAEDVELLNGNILNIISELKRRGYTSLYVDGGKTIQGFLRNNLIDEMIITRTSTLLGTGIPLFNGLESKTTFKITECKKLNDYMIQEIYLKSK